MIDETSKMPDYQWKLTIIERNLLPSNWIKLMPEAQTQMLWEANELLTKLSVTDKRHLLTSLEILQNYTSAEFQRKIEQILNNQSSLALTQAA